MERPTATPHTPGTSATPSVDAIEQRVVAFAEQLGRLVGTVQAKADGWMDRPALQEQVTRIRDGAAGLLRQLGPVQNSRGGKRRAKAGARAKAAKATGVRGAAGSRSGGKVDAPGKKHRKPAVPPRPVKKSDLMVAKEKASEQMRRGPKKGG
jgi:hypothetical protein